jgi:DNA-binding response OmpR family regulator
MGAREKQKGTDMKKILVIEDEESILMALEDDLTFEGYQVETAMDGIKGLSLAEKKTYDLIILDIMLPGLDGYEICKKLRAEGFTTPILMLTAKSQEIDKVLGLELGADDYVTKPFSPRELQARVKAHLRRSALNNSAPEKFRFGDVEIDFKKYETTKSGRTVNLTSLEYDLLHYLISHRGEVVSRDDILDAVWGRDVYINPRTVDKHVSGLRKKLEDDLSSPRYITGVRGVGYKFSME